MFPCALKDHINEKNTLLVVKAVRNICCLQMCGICDQKSGSLPTVAYAVLVAHFLQQTSPPILPTVRQVATSNKPEDFPEVEDVKSNLKSTNKDSVGMLWLHMLHYYGYKFKFVAHNVNVTQTGPSPRTDRSYSKKMSIEDPFNPKRNLTRTVSNAGVLEFIMDRLLKVLCRYFSVPQLPYGQLFYTLTIDNMLVKEKRTLNSSISESEKTTSESEDKNDNSELQLALDRLALIDESADSLDAPDASPSSKITSPDQLNAPFDTITSDEVIRIVNMLEVKDYDFQFLEQKFTEGESVPIYCTCCQKEGHTRHECEDEKLPELLELPPANAEHLRIISSVLVKLKEEMEPRQQEITQRQQVVEKLQFFIRKEPKYREAALQLFGSSANGFGFCNSDLDVCITFNDDTAKEELDQNAIIYDLARILKQSREFSEVFAIPTAKVPIVKFRDSDSNFDGDLSLFNTLALHNTNMLRTYSNIDPRVRVSSLKHLHLNIQNHKIITKSKTVVIMTICSKFLGYGVQYCVKYCAMTLSLITVPVIRSLAMD